MQCACAILLYVAYPAVLYFSTLSHKRNYFRQKVTERKICVLILSCITFFWHIFYSEKNRARYDQKYVPVFTSRSRYSGPTVMRLEFSRQFSEKYSNIKFHENPSIGPELFSVDWRTDGRIYKAKLIVAFRYFANPPKNCFTLCNAMGCVHKTNASNFTELRRNRTVQ
jgi:hypothetical protein